MAIIPVDRRITWQGSVGLASGIPERTTIFANVKNAPYNAAGDGVTNDTTAIQSAINACPSGQVVYIPNGTYMVTYLRMKSNITLRGESRANTIVKGIAGSQSRILCFESTSYYYQGEYETGKNITAGVAKGSSTLTIVNHGYSAGDMLVIDQLDDQYGDPPITAQGNETYSGYVSRENGHRPIGQIAVVDTVVSANVFTIEIPLYYDYDVTRTPQAARVRSTFITNDAGVEHLRVDNSVSHNANQENYATVLMSCTLRCWLLDVDIRMCRRTTLKLFVAYRCFIHGCEIRESYAYTSSAGYGMWLTYGCSACLIENNYWHDLTTGYIDNGPTSGNVMAYNYMSDMSSTDYPNSTRNGLIHHGAHPIMILWEGNYLDGPCISLDLYHGTSSHTTIFRNRVIDDVTKTVGTACVSIWEGNTYVNLVGNVLGTQGHETIYQSTDLYAGKMIYNMDQGTFQGPLPSETLYRHGDFEYVTDSVTWDASNSDHDLPDSLYLSSKPAWWGTGGWPVIGSDLDPMASTIPADPNYVPIEEGEPEEPTIPDAGPVGSNILMGW